MSPKSTEKSWAVALENEGLVHSLVGKFLRQYKLPIKVDRQDLIQAGLMAAEIAGRYYNPEMGCKFSTYAAPAIKQRIWEECHRQASGHPRQRKFDPPAISIEAQHGPRSSDDGNADDTLPAFLNEAIGLTPSAEDEYLEHVPDDRVTELRSILADLDSEASVGNPYGRKGRVIMPLELRRLTAHFVDGRSMADIAADEGVSLSAISQSIKAALRKLRLHLHTLGFAA